MKTLIVTVTPKMATYRTIMECVTVSEGSTISKSKTPPIQICMQYAVIVVADSEHSSSFSELGSSPFITEPRSFFSTAIIQIKIRKLYLTNLSKNIIFN
ncbi:hypothetical protein [Peribacillus simplex]|uniref:hypothetical protein n=1 Tax=Peribacillus simplex TaxID=1478 RepID=UPI0036716A11